MDAKEGKEVDVKDILDKEILFDIDSFQIVRPYQGGRECFIVIVKSAQLEKIREDQGLEKIKHAFHITIGIRRQS